MTITYAGVRSLDSHQPFVAYEATIDGKKVSCAITQDALRCYFEDMGDPLATFDSSRLAILDFTRRVADHRGLPEGDRLVIGRDDLYGGP
jgi:hypothetical protein